MIDMRVLISIATVMSLFIHDTRSQIWEPVRMTINAQRLLAISFPDSTNGWMVGNKPGDDDRSYIIHTSDGGENWSVQQSAVNDQLQDVHFTDSLRGWILGVKSLQMTIDGGASWDSIDLGTFPEPLRLVEFNFIGNTVYAIGDGGAFLKSTDEAKTWVGLDLPEEASFYTALDFINADTGIVVGGRSTDHFLARTFDGGDTWQILEVNQGSQGRLNDVRFINDTLVYACGIFGKVLKSTDGGNTWELLPRIEVAFTSVQNVAMWFENADTGWIASQHNANLAVFIHRTDDGGETWDQQLLFSRSPVHTIHDIKFDESGTGWACGHQEGLDLNGEVILRGIEDTISSVYGPDGLSSSVKKFDIYPNPMKQQARIDVELTGAMDVQIGIYTISGQLLRTIYSGGLSGAVHRFQFERNGLKSGIYLVTLTAPGGVITRKFVVMD